MVNLVTPRLDPSFRAYSKGLESQALPQEVALRITHAQKAYFQDPSVQQELLRYCPRSGSYEFTFRAFEDGTVHLINENDSIQLTKKMPVITDVFEHVFARPQTPAEHPQQPARPPEPRQPAPLQAQPQQPINPPAGYPVAPPVQAPYQPPFYYPYPPQPYAFYPPYPPYQQEPCNIFTDPLTVNVGHAEELQRAYARVKELENAEQDRLIKPLQARLAELEALLLPLKEKEKQLRSPFRNNLPIPLIGNRAAYLQTLQEIHEIEQEIVNISARIRSAEAFKQSPLTPFNQQREYRPAYSTYRHEREFQDLGFSPEDKEEQEEPFGFSRERDFRGPFYPPFARERREQPERHVRFGERPRFPARDIPRSRAPSEESFVSASESASEEELEAETVGTQLTEREIADLNAILEEINKGNIADIDEEALPLIRKALLIPNFVDSTQKAALLRLWHEINKKKSR